MKIQGINTQNIISTYKNNIGKNTEKVERINSKDTIEISALGKTLKNYSLDSASLDRSAKIEKIKAQIENGTYNVSAKLTAKSIIDTIKGDKI